MIELRLTNSNNTSSSSFNESLEQILNITPTIPLTIMNIIGQQQHISIFFLVLCRLLPYAHSQHGDDETDDDQRQDTLDTFSEGKLFHKDNYTITPPNKQQEQNNNMNLHYVQ
ncbi:unnamed protein product [Rotaria sordida]|uniref:Uncharacterized protein n=1 Tax=Rotaria sordida TaxID=392033 RepID=A0A819UK78_9BILA|nr:unnamed protein product [Rotaria sordida]